MTKLPPMVCKPHRIPYCRQCMMEKTTDLEMLEMAAKAAGIEFTIWHDKPAQVISYGNHLRETRFCNPLQSDGDAFRLAVKLGIGLEFDFDRIDAISEVARATEYLYEKPVPTDRYAATRRAIVRAASEIGSNS